MSDQFPGTISEFLDQDEFWVNKSGWLPISDMNSTHRRRAAQFLLRRARFFGAWDLEETGHQLSNPSDEVKEFVGRLAAPTSFIKDTPLYLSLIEGGADPDAYNGDDDDD